MDKKFEMFFTWLERSANCTTNRYKSLAYFPCFDKSEVFSGIVEVDEIYIFLEYFVDVAKVWAEVVPDVEANTLKPLIYRWVKQGSTICSDTRLCP